MFSTFRLVENFAINPFHLLLCKRYRNISFSTCSKKTIYFHAQHTSMICAVIIPPLRYSAKLFQRPNTEEQSRTYQPPRHWSKRSRVVRRLGIVTRKPHMTLRHMLMIDWPEVKCVTCANSNEFILSTFSPCTTTSPSVASILLHIVTVDSSGEQHATTSPTCSSLCHTPPKPATIIKDNLPFLLQDSFHSRLHTLHMYNSP